MGVTFKQLHDVLKKILKAIEAERGSIAILSAKSGVSALIPVLRQILAAVLPLDGNTDGLEGLLSLIDGNTDGLEALLNQIDILLTTANSTQNAILNDTDGIQTLITDTNTKLDTLDTNTDQIEALLTAMGALLTTIDADTSFLSDIDSNTDGLETLIAATNALLTTIDVDTGFLPNIDADTGNIELNTASIQSTNFDIESHTDDLNGKFGVLGSMGLLIVSLSATVLLINAKLTAGGFDNAEWLEKIETSTEGIRGRVLDTNVKLDTLNGRRIWEFEATYTCTVAGTLIITWPVLTDHTISNLEVSLFALPLTAAIIYQIKTVRTSSGVFGMKIGQVSMIVLTHTQMLGQPWRGKVLGTVDSLQMVAVVGAAGHTIGDVGRLAIRATIVKADGAAPAFPVPVITGTGTFTQGIVSNQVVTY